MTHEKEPTVTKLLHCEPTIPTIASHMEPQTLSSTILHKIEQSCLNVVTSVVSGNAPEFSFPRHSTWNELVFGETVGLHAAKADQRMTKVRFDRPNSVKKFAAMLKILKLIYTLVQEDRYCTKRDIFYQYPDLYGCQSTLDKVIDDVACMLSVPRWELHILATSKGLVAGCLKFEDQEGSLFDCTEGTTGLQIPAHTKDMKNMQSQARFVLVVEKDATFQKLMGQQFCQKFQDAILITGKGFPDNGTRLLLKSLWNQYRLSILILVDGDPHGIEIMAVYKFGSMAQAYESQHLAVPSMEWIGILPEDIERFQIPATALIPLTVGDRKKCQALAQRPYFKHDEIMQAQLELLLECDKKAEIQCLDAISSNFLCDVYLPDRINLLVD